MSQHTPGPWTIEPEHIDDEDGSYHEPVIMANDGMLIVAVIRVGTGQDEANARLIAAAPDLLTALVEIAKGEGRFSCDPLEHASNTIDDMKALALAAIAKAEGR